MSKWKEYKLGDVTQWSSGGTPSKSNDAFWGGDIPWVSATSMKGNRFSESSLKITEAGLSSGSRLAKRDSVLLLVRGSTLHQRILVGITERDVAFNQDVKAIVPNEEFLDSWYLLFWFMSIEKDLLNMVENTGIGAGKLDTKLLQNLIIKIPPKEEREKIKACAKAIDDKLVLNSQTNQTLEQIAQALFKSWFVDFEPTRAKIAAKKRWQALNQTIECSSPTCYAEQFDKPKQNNTGLEAAITTAAMCAISGKTEEQLKELNEETLQQLKATAALFPDTLVDSELREMPEGWRVKALDEIAHYQNGLALQKFRPEADENSLPVLKIAQLKKGFADGEERASTKIKPECIVDNGDVVFSWSGSLLVDVWCGGTVALNQHLFKVSSNKYPKWLYFYWTKHHLSKFQQIAADKAVTMGHIKREHLAQAKCVIPSNELSSKMILHDLLEKQIEQRLEANSLQCLRDTLLPKLLSGEISVPTAEYRHDELLA